MKTILTIFIIVLMVPYSAHAGLKEKLNPTALWECRDSLQSLRENARYGDMAIALLHHIDEINTELKQSITLIPSPMFRLDVFLYQSPLDDKQREELEKRINKKNYDVLGVDSHKTLSAVSYQEQPYIIVSINDPLCQNLIHALEHESDNRLQEIRKLVMKVQTEIALVRTALAMKRYRQEEQTFIWWVNALVVTEYTIDIEHFKRIGQLFKTQTSIYD